MKTGWLNNLRIGRKLTIGFGILVALTLLVVGLSYLGSRKATQEISNTDEVRVPTALVAARAQADLLRVQADARGYLALGDQEFRDSYRQDAQAFEGHLRDLMALAPKLEPADQERLQQISATYQQWSQYPEKLFDLRDDQLEREPAYAIFATDGLRRGGSVLIDTGKLIDEQGLQAPTADNQALLAEMARFQGSFSAMLSGLRGYVTTRNRTFRGEYEANRDLNQLAWDSLSAKRDSLTPRQQALLDSITANRDAFLLLPDQIFAILESDRWRQDLYLFRSEALPLSANMLQALSTLTENQQDQLSADLDHGKQSLSDANLQTLAGGAVAVLLGVLLAIVFRENIAGPIRRLTAVVQQIGAGDLDARAQIESSDEIGTLAGAFNGMTGQLQDTLEQTRMEKKRADDLLHVVIPIGVDLSAEKDFDRLLEKILVEAKNFCRADSGILFLRTEMDELEHVIVRNDKLAISMGGSAGHQVSFPAVPLYDATTHAALDYNPVARAALSGRSVNLRDAAEMAELDFSGIAAQTDDAYRADSFLAIPLKNSDDHVLGVLQLANAQEPETGRVIPFDANLQQMMESYSSLAVAALEAYIREQGLRQQIQQLRIEIDEVKRQKQVDEIVETDFFQDLQAKARAIRTRSPRARPDAPAGDAPVSQP
jgi:CHASE3 domain sensor protein